MAEILTRTYIYTGKGNWTAGNSSVPLSAFAVSGDMRPVTQILSISASWWRYQNTSSTIAHTAQITFGSGAADITSNTVSRRGDGDIWNPGVVFSTMPDAADWAEENVTFHTRINTKQSSVYWMASAARPMIITITFVSSEFKPSISNALLYRANDFGAASGTGQYLTFSAGLKLEKEGTNGSGTLEIYENTTKEATTEGTLIYYQADMDVSTAATSIILTPIPAYSIAIGDKRYFYIRFSYTAETESGVPNTESIAVKFYIGSTFTNVHLARASTGGVAFGKFSASTEGNPLFECEYPAIFSGGIQGVTSYAEGEIQTGGKWIDGKPIYRNVISTTTSAGGSSEVIGNIAADFGTVIRAWGMLRWNGTGTVIPLTYAYYGSINLTAGILIGADGGVQVQLGSSYSGTHSVIVVLEYTKIVEEEEETPGTGDIPQQGAGSDSAGNVTITASNFSMTDDGSGGLEITQWDGYTASDDGDGNITFAK